MLIIIIIWEIISIYSPKVANFLCLSWEMSKLFCQELRIEDRGLKFMNLQYQDKH